MLLWMTEAASLLGLMGYEWLMLSLEIWEQIRRHFNHSEVSSLDVQRLFFYLWLHFHSQMFRIF